MGKLINLIVKGLGYFGIYLVTLLESFILSIIGMGSIISIVLGVWSFFAPIPLVFTDRYGLALLTASVVPSIILFIYILTHLKK